MQHNISNYCWGAEIDRGMSAKRGREASRLQSLLTKEKSVCEEVEQTVLSDVNDLFSPLVCPFPYCDAKESVSFDILSDCGH